MELLTLSGRPANRHRVLRTIPRGSSRHEITGQEIQHHLEVTGVAAYLNETSIEAYHTMIRNLHAGSCDSYGHTFIKNLVDLGHRHRTITNFVRRHPQLLLKNWLIFNVLINGNHWAVLLVNTVHRSISYYDSLHNDGTRYTSAMNTLLSHIERTNEEATSVSWREFPNAYCNLPRQANGTDCGLYAMLIPELLLASIPLTVLSPAVAQGARLYTATCLLKGTLGNLSNMLSTYSIHTSGPRDPALNTPSISLIPEQTSTPKSISVPVLRGGVFEIGTRHPTTHSRPRRQKATPLLIPTPYTPPKLHEVTIQDPARLHTYAGYSWQIPGERGLFAGTQLQAGDKVGEYFGGEHLTKSQVYAPTYMSRYAIDVRGIIRDCWCPHSKHVLCMTGFINDLLDESKDNCHWVRRGRRIYVYVNADKPVMLHEEFSIPYGNEYWADPAYPLELLQKAAKRYANDIDHSPGSPWRSLPQYDLIFPERVDTNPPRLLKRSAPLAEDRHQKKTRQRTTSPPRTDRKTPSSTISDDPLPEHISGNKRSLTAIRSLSRSHKRLACAAEGTSDIHKYFIKTMPPQETTSRLPETRDESYDKRSADS